MWDKIKYYFGLEGAIVIVALSFFLVAVGVTIAQTNKAEPDNLDLPTKTYKISNHWVTTYTLPDGTRCVSGYNVGITCDWSRK